MSTSDRSGTTNDDAFSGRHLRRQISRRLDAARRSPLAVPARAIRLGGRGHFRPVPLASGVTAGAESRHPWTSAGTGSSKISSPRMTPTASAAGRTRSETRWAREMRLRHALIDGNENPETKATKARAWCGTRPLLPRRRRCSPLMCDWHGAVSRTVMRDEERGGVFLPDLDGWATGPLGKIKGVEALKTCAKLVQEDLCFVKEETLEEAWDAVDESFGSFDEDEDENETHTRHAFRAGVVCFSFDPEKRRGKTLAGLHTGPCPGAGAHAPRRLAGLLGSVHTEKPLWPRQLGVAEQRRDRLHRRWSGTRAT